jgi:L-threonylcarbamoyladenylate synthase
VEIIKHNDFNRIVAVVCSGGVLAYPTDTVWGLGCNALDTNAVERVLSAKGKPDGAKLIWLLSGIKQVKKYFPNVTAQEQKLLGRRRTTVVVGNTAIRIIKTGWLNKFITRCDVPIVSTSANLHGGKTAESWRQAVELFGGKIDAVVHGRKIYHGVPSLILTVENGEVKILRGVGGIHIK